MPTATEPKVDLTDFHVVMKSGWKATDLPLEAGEVVDTSEWRNVPPLLQARMLMEAPYTLLDTMVECPCERLWVDEEASLRHQCPAR